MKAGTRAALAATLLAAPLAAPTTWAARSGSPTIQVERFEFEGNTVFSDEQLQSAAASFRGRPLTSADLRKLQDTLTRLYIAVGYVNSGVTLPDQEFAGGVLRLKVVEGVLEGVKIKGRRWARKSFVTRRLGPYGDPGRNEILHVGKLNARLELLRQDPRIRSVRGDLKPGSEPGKAELDVHVQEHRPWRIDTSFSNYTSPSIGDSLRQVRVQNSNLTGRGDALSLSFGETEGANFGSASYSWFLGGNPHRSLSIDAGKSAAAIVTQGFNQLGIKSETESIGITYRHDLEYSARRHRTAGVNFTVEDNRTSFGGIPFSFAGGGANGKSKATVFKLFHDWTERKARSGWHWHTSLDVGVDLGFGGITKGPEPDAQFFAWRNQFAYLKHLGNHGHQAFFRFSSQFANDTMLPMERFLIGGHNTVRGYRENQLNTDSGMIGGLEFRLPIGKPREDRAMYFVPFLDYGKGWNEGRDPAIDELGSAGAGLRLKLKRWTMDVFWGENFQGVPTPPGHDLQDDGLHFQVGYRLY